MHFVFDDNATTDMDTECLPNTRHDAIRSTAVRAGPRRAGEWLAERRARLDTRLKEFGRAARTGTNPGGIIENGKLHIDKLRADTPEGAEDLVLDLYQQLPPARITDLLLEVDERTGFSEAFTHLRTGAPCSDRLGLMNVLLAEGVNLGLRKMAAATNTHRIWEVLRIARWHGQGSAYERAGRGGGSGTSVKEEVELGV